MGYWDGEYWNGTYWTGTYWTGSYWSGMGGVAAVTATFTANAADTTDTTAYTFSGKSFGDASAGRKIVVVIFGRAVTGTHAISTVTIGGVSATEVVAQLLNSTGGNSLTMDIYIADVPTGTSGDIVVTYANTGLRCGICVYAMTGAASSVASASGSSVADDPTATITIPANGSAIGGAATGAATSSTATGLTEDADFAVETGTMTSGSVNSVAGGSTALTFDFAAPVISGGIFAAWAP